MISSIVQTRLTRMCWIPNSKRDRAIDKLAQIEAHIHLVSSSPFELDKETNRSRADFEARIISNYRLPHQ